MAFGFNRIFAFVEGELRARRARRDAADHAASSHTDERPDDWRASDGPSPSWQQNDADSDSPDTDRAPDGR